MSIRRIFKQSLIVRACLYIGYISPVCLVHFLVFLYRDHAAIGAFLKQKKLPEDWHFIFPVAAMGLVVFSMLGLMAYFRNLRKREVALDGREMRIVSAKNVTGVMNGDILKIILSLEAIKVSDVTLTPYMCALYIIYYFVYIRSEKILCQPILSFTHSLYEITYELLEDSLPCKVHSGRLIITEISLEIGDSIFVEEIGSNIFHGITKEKRERKMK